MDLTVRPAPVANGRRTKLLVSVLAIVAMLTTSVFVVAPQRADALSRFDQEILTLINDYRATLDLDPLIEIVSMSDAAEEWSYEVYARGVTRPRCDAIGEVNTGPDARLQGVPEGVTTVIEGVSVTCGNTGFLGGFTSSGGALFPECEGPRSHTEAIDQYCDLVHTDIGGGIFSDDVEFIGIGTRRLVESTNILGDEVRMVTTVRMASTQPCLGYEVTIDMNENGGDGTGTPGPDVILGTPGPDVIDAGDGDDVICSGDGDDIIEAGTGDDIVVAGVGDDKVFGRRGDDRIDGGFGDDTIHGNKGEDNLRGGPGADKIFGYADDDKISGGLGDDRLHGNFGDDTVLGDEGNDRIFGYGDNDLLVGGDGNDLLAGNFGDDRLQGHEGNDVLFGGDGNDIVRGDGGDDRLEGNSMNDTVEGGHGNDVIDGGIGRDVCDGGHDFDTATRCEEVTFVP